VTRQASIKRTELAATPEDPRLVLLIDVVDEYAIFLLDQDGRVATWNVGAARIKGYRADEILGEHFSIFYTAEDIASDKPARELAEATATGQYREESWRVRKDGSVFWANVVITAMFGTDGDLQGFAKITRDDSDRKIAADKARAIDRLRDREAIAEGLHQKVIHRVFEAGMVLEGALGLTSDPALQERIEAAVALLEATLTDVRHVALGLAADDG
jgi:PAS domain S-box-containing protein